MIKKSIHLWMISFLWFIPIVILILNSFKSFDEIIRNPLGIPDHPTMGNFITLWVRSDYLRLFLNSIQITVLSVALTVILGSMTAYYLSKNERLGKYALAIIALAIITPFQSIMIPLIRLLTQLNFIDHKMALVLVYTALLTPLGIYLYYAQVKKIPKALEEAAMLDGANNYFIFLKVIFPQLKSVSITIIILNSLWIWNDFLLPLLVIQSDKNKTLALGTYSLFTGEYTNRMNLSMAAILLASIPMIVLFVILQKKITESVMNGSVKG